MIDRELIRSLHVESMRRRDVHPEHEPHVLFQASTIGALLDGAYDGDMTFTELGEHGDLGLGTVNALDGEMVAVDGRFYRAAVDGRVSELDPQAKTPFAVVVWFAPDDAFEISGADSYERLTAEIDRRLPADATASAIRIEGEFARIEARSVPRQQPPYRPLPEVIGEQNVFDLTDVEGTMVGFRFPAYAQGIEVPGYHLHFVSSDRRRGGHVLDCRAREVLVELDPSADLHLELPPAIDLNGADVGRDMAQALARVERSGD
jgi:acetolactate decarboxylase